MLGVDQLSGEIGDARELGGVAVVVVVVAGAQVEESGPVGRRSVRRVDPHRPGVRIGTEVGPSNLGGERDLAVDAVIAGGVLQVVTDIGAVGDGIAFVPGVVPEAQCVDIAVGSDSGVPEQVPGPADAFPALDDMKAAARRAQSDGGIDAGYSGSHNENVK